MVDQDTAPKELFYTEGPAALREARLQACCPSHTLLGSPPYVCRKPVQEHMVVRVVFATRVFTCTLQVFRHVAVSL